MTTTENRTCGFRPNVQPACAEYEFLSHLLVSTLTCIQAAESKLPEPSFALSMFSAIRWSATWRRATRGDQGVAVELRNTLKKTRKCFQALAGAKKVLHQAEFARSARTRLLTRCAPSILLSRSDLQVFAGYVQRARRLEKQTELRIRRAAPTLHTFV